MSFTSYTFLFFFIGTAALYYVVPHRLQNTLLLISSYVFYMWAAPQYGLALFATTAVTYGCALWMGGQTAPARRKLLLALLAVLNIGVLFLFKYYDFFRSLLTQAGVPLPVFSLAITAGLSFYIFQLVGYCVDVYRGNIQAERNFIDFALFVSFFPQILSGPIGRAGELMPQYKRARVPVYENLRDGSLRFLLGMFKKLVIADNLARYVDAVYANISNSYGLTLWITVILYALQIYADFSAYTDMAVGVARFIGIACRENFFVPYASGSVRAFWSRWHMSLSTWFRDYLYIPLGGSRRGFAVKLINTLIVFLVSGLWHGAALTFILWGAWHGIFRILEELFGKVAAGIRRKRGTDAKTDKASAVRRIAGMVYTCIVVFLGWVLFRADYVAQIPVIAKNLFVNRPLSETVDWIYGVMSANVSSSPAYAKMTLALLGAAVVAWLLSDVLLVRNAKEGERQYNPLLYMPVWARNVACFFMIACILVIGVFGGSSFIYYQF